MSMLLVCLLAAAAPALAPAPAFADDPARLAWLEGRWTGTQGGVDMEETWSSAAGGALLGMHKDVKGGKMTSWEFMRIDATPKGLAFFASPRSAPPVVFPAVEVGTRRVVFGNETHDFPQRILYWLDDKGALHARIEGRLRGKAASQEWTWSRAVNDPGRVIDQSRTRRHRITV